MAAVSSGYVEIDITATNLSIRVTGDFQAPDRYHLTLQIGQGGISIKLEMITIGRENYIKNPLTSLWETEALPLRPFNDLFEYGAFNTDFDPDTVAGFNLVGIVQLDDEHVYHLRGPVTGDALADLLDDSPVQGRHGEVDYWIGIEDSLVRRVAIRTEVPAGSDGSTSVTEVVMTLSDYGKPVDIEAPDS